MKKIFYKNYILMTILTVILFLNYGCVDKLDTFNDNHTQAYTTLAETQLSSAQKELVDQMNTPNVNLNVLRFFQHYWAMTTYGASDAIFDFKARIVPDNQWRILYARVLGNLASAKESVKKEQRPGSLDENVFKKQQANKIAIIDMIQVYTLQILVDSFGDVPYTDINPENALFKYDDASAIYKQLIKRVEKDLDSIDITQSSFGSGDLWLNGDVSRWKLFGNSLKLKLGISLSDFDNALAKKTVESAYNGGVILDNSQSVMLKYQKDSPNFNQVYTELVTTQRNDFVAAKEIVDKMNDLNDPRRSVYFNKYEEKDNTGKITFSGYKGAVVGIKNKYADYSHIGDKLVEPDAPDYLFDAAEINFYLAEAAARKYAVGGTVEMYYDNAIKASFDQWGITDKKVVKDYLKQPEVAYSSAKGDFKQKIGIQAWIAMFNRGFVSWNFFRRFDFPKLTAPNAVSDAKGQVPSRLTYPIKEKTVNGANWRKASEKIGGDKLTAKIFWDVN